MRATATSAGPCFRRLHEAQGCARNQHLGLSPYEYTRIGNVNLEKLGSREPPRTMNDLTRWKPMHAGGTCSQKSYCRTRILNVSKNLRRNGHTFHQRILALPADCFTYEHVQNKCARQVGIPKCSPPNISNSYFPCSFESFSAMQLGHAKADKHYAGATTHNGESNELLMLLTKGWQAAFASPWTWSPARRNRRSHFLEADDKIYKSRKMSPENIKFVHGFCGCISCAKAALHQRHGAVFSRLAVLP